MLYDCVNPFHLICLDMYTNLILYIVQAYEEFLDGNVELLTY